MNSMTIRPQQLVCRQIEDTGICDVEEEQDEAGSRRPAELLDPQLPTKAEMEEHDLTRLPFRNWRPHCVRGAGRAAAHRVHLQDDALPEVHMDYCFLGTEGSQTKTVLVVRERPHRMTMSTVVPMKGASLEWAVRRVLAFIRSWAWEAATL